MKVRLSIDLDLPDGLQAHPDGIGQLLFDQYINFVPVQHYCEALKWLDEKTPNADKIVEIHKEWGNIASQPHWTYSLI